MTADDLHVALDALQDDADVETAAWAWSVFELLAGSHLPLLARARAGTHTEKQYTAVISVVSHLSCSRAAGSSLPVSLHHPVARSASSCWRGRLADSLCDSRRCSLDTRRCLL